MEKLALVGKAESGARQSCAGLGWGSLCVRNDKEVHPADTRLRSEQVKLRLARAGQSQTARGLVGYHKSELNFTPNEWAAAAFLGRGARSPCLRRRETQMLCRWLLGAGEVRGAGKKGRGFH